MTVSEAKRQAPDGTVGGECATEEAAYLSDAGASGHPRSAAKKVATTPARRQSVQSMCTDGLTQHHALRVVGMSASSLRYQTVPVRIAVTNILDGLAVTRGLPRVIRTDNGKEFCGRATLP